MALSDKSKNIPPLEKTADMLNEEHYWSIIQQSLEATNDQDEMEQHLIVSIEKLTPREMIGFRLRTDYLMSNAYTSALWCAGYIINGGCSDDGFEYFRLWIISGGKELYYKATENPDSLTEYVDKDNDGYEFEGLTYVAHTAFEKKTGKDLYAYIDEKKFKYREGDVEMKFTWEEEDPDSQKKVCPKLYAKFIGK